MSGFGGLILAQLRLWRRMPIIIASSLVAPLGLAALLLVLSFSVTQQRVALVVGAHGPAAAHMRELIVSDTDAYIIDQTTAARAQQLLHAQKVAAIITIPDNFDHTVTTGQAQLDLVLNNIDIDFGDDIRRAVTRSAAEYDAPQLGQAGQLGQLPAASASGFSNPYLINIAEHDIHRTDVGFLPYQVIPAYILLILSVGMMGTAALVATDNERGLTRYLALSPQRPWPLMAARTIGGFCASLTVVVPAVIFGFASGILNPPLSHLLALLALFVISMIFACGLGSALGAIAKTTRLVALSSSVVATYLFFLGGGFTTIAFLPRWIQDISAFAPTRYAIDGMRQALFYPTLRGVGFDIAVIAFSSIIVLSLGAIAQKRTLTR